MKQAKKHFGFLKTTAIGGLLFLLPLIVVGALIGQIAPIVMSIATTLNSVLDVKTAEGIALLIGLAISILLLTCFAAGVFARWSLGKKLSGFFEKKLVLLFPRYAILKDQMADSIGGNEFRAQMKPVLVRFNDSLRVAFETERRDDSDWVSVYLPGAPDPWAGHVAIVEKSRVRPLRDDFGDAAATCEQLGRGIDQLIQDSGLPRRLDEWS